MAKVPTARSQRIGTQVTQAPQTPFQSVSTSPDMFGATQGQQIGELGKAVFGVTAEMQAEAERQQALNDAVSRQRILGEFDQAINKIETEAQTVNDISDPATVSQAQAQSQVVFEQLLGGHSGTSESSARLRIALMDRMNQSVARTFQASQEARRNIVVDGITSQFAGISDAAIGGMPIEQAEASIDDIVNSDASSLTAAEEQELRDAGRATIYTDMFNHYMTGGGGVYQRNIQSAESLLSNPGVRQAVGDTAYRKMSASVFAAKRKEMAGTLAGQKALEKAAFILGIPASQLTPTQRRKIAGVDDPLTAAQKNLAVINELGLNITAVEQAQILSGKTPPRFQQLNIESALGRKLTESELERHYSISEAAFGTGLEGKARSRIANDTEAFEAGLLNPREEQLFLQAVSAVAVPSRDPVTGRTTYSIPGGRTILAQAFASRDMDLDGFLNNEAQRTGSAAAPEVGAAAPEVRAGGAVDPRFGVGGVMMADGAAAPEVGAGGGMMEEQLPSEPEFGVAGGPTIWEQASDIAGIGSFAERQIRRVPIGAISGSVSGKATQAANLTQNRLNDLVRVLQNNPQFAERERAQIRDDLNIDPKGIQSLDAFQDKLIAIDTSLRERQKQAIATLVNRSSTVQERTWAASVLPRIQNFLDRLGAPVLVETESDAAKLPPGTVFRYGGNDYRVPDRGGSSEKK
jgi:hypothetical protein